MTQPAADFEIDITGEVCPMTFVRAKLLLERMPPGGRARIRLRAGEALRNVPRGLAEHGWRPEPAQAEPDGAFTILVTK